MTLPEGYFDNAVGPEPFQETIKRFGGPGAQQEWDRLTKHLLDLSECTMGLPPFSLRTGPGAVITLATFLPTLFKVIKAGPRFVTDQWEDGGTPPTKAQVCIGNVNHVEGIKFTNIA